ASASSRENPASAPVKRTGLGRFREFRVSNYQLMMDLISYCRTHGIDDILALPDVKERLAALGAEPSAMSSADFSSWLRNEIAASAKVVRDEKITID
ncbi:MAG: hypothetical protein EBX67_06280, partial [Betaproteobacteria bacterium]|nr:hypothetical protein [Betaproteobacteria bacterium]